MTIDRYAVVEAPQDLAAVGADWEALAAHAGTPFLTTDWVLAWWQAFGARLQGRSNAFVLLGRDGAGTVRTGAFLQRQRGGRVATATNVHTTDWDVLAVDESDRRSCWEEVTRRGGQRLHLAALSDTAAATAGEAMRAAGFAVFASATEANPRLELPATWEELGRGISKNLRSQVQRQERHVRAAGDATFRTTRGGPTLERDLASFFRLEAAGWKGGTGTAILAERPTTTLYRNFALAAAASGRLRLHLLELDDVLIGADLSYRLGGGAFLIKTTYSEDHARLSPGLVLRAEAIRASIAEGCSFYDFLGGPEPYKLRWGATPVSRWTVDGYRHGWRPVAAYRKQLRPLLKAGRDRVRGRYGGRASASSPANSGSD